MRWEYKTIKLAAPSYSLGGILDEAELTALLNNLGRDRWELVSVFDTNQSGGASRDIVAVFKRPLEKAK